MKVDQRSDTEQAVAQSRRVCLSRFVSQEVSASRDEEAP